MALWGHRNALPVALLLLVPSVACVTTPLVTPAPTMVRKFSGTEVAGGYVSPSAYQHFVLAELALDDGKIPEAIEMYRRAIVADPISAYLRTELAELWRRSGQLDLAREQADLALELDPSYAEAILVKAKIKEQLDHPIATEALLQQAAQTQPPSEEANAELVSFYERHQDPTKALAAAKRFVDTLPAAYEAHVLYARLLGANLQSDRALAEYQWVVDRWPDRLEPRIALSDLLAGRDRLSESIVQLEAAYRRSPEVRIAALLVRRLVLADHGEEAETRADEAEYLIKKPDQWLLLAQMRLDVGQPQAAIEALIALLATTTQTGLGNEARLLTSDALLRLGKTEEALHRLADIKAGAAEHPASTVRRLDILLRAARCEEAKRELASSELPRLAKVELGSRVLECTGDRAAAIAQCRSENQLLPAPALSLLLAELLLRDGQMAPALEAARLAQQKLPTSVRAQLAYATLLSKVGRGKEALTLVETAQAREPDSPLYAGQIGLILFEQRLADRAERWLSRALRLDPVQPQLLDALAEIQLARGERPAALALLRRALSLPCEPALRQQIEQRLLLLDGSRSAKRSSPQ